MKLEHTTVNNTTVHTTKRNGLRGHPVLTLFLGLLLFLGIVGLTRDASNKKSTPPHAVARVAGTHTGSPTAAPSATPPPQPSRLPKQTFLLPNLTPMQDGKYYRTRGSWYCVGRKCYVPPPLVNGAADPPALDITGYPGMDKVIINASLKTTDTQLHFTNNEDQDWKRCFAIINPDSGSDNWYEYDFQGIPAGQTYTVPWGRLMRKDGTPYTNVANEPKIIQLSCVLDDNYDAIGFAKFHYSSLGATQQE